MKNQNQNQDSLRSSNIKTIINLVKTKFLTRSMTIANNKNKIQTLLSVRRDGEWVERK